MAGNEDTRNQIQKDCSNLSDDAEFVVGEVYGLRQWQLHEPARPVPYMVGHNGGRWNLYDTNHAECNRTSEAVSDTFSLAADELRDLPEEYLARLLVARAREFISRYEDLRVVTVSLVGASYPSPKLVVSGVTEDAPALPWVVANVAGRWWVEGTPRNKNARLDFRLNGSVPIRPHRPAHPPCTCGFYAYNNRASLQRNSRTYGDVIFGLIRAYGRVTQGTLGFRAEKAQVVSLTRPLEAQMGDYVEFDPLSSGFTPLDRYFMAWARPPRAVNWLPSDNAVVNEAFDRIVPDTISVVDGLDELVELGSHLLNPPDNESERPWA